MQVTLKSLPTATVQEVFDTVVGGLIAQKDLSHRGDGLYCAYRVERGMVRLKCAAGQLIADDEYNEEFEGRLWRQLATDGLVPKDHADFIQTLQKIHDTAVNRARITYSSLRGFVVNVDDWIGDFQRVALTYELDFKFQKGESGEYFKTE